MVMAQITVVYAQLHLFIILFSKKTADFWHKVGQTRDHNIGPSNIFFQIFSIALLETWSEVWSKLQWKKMASPGDSWQKTSGQRSLAHSTLARSAPR
jgi:hypothetical protein